MPHVGPGDNGPGDGEPPEDEPPPLGLLVPAKKAGPPKIMSAVESLIVIKAAESVLKTKVVGGSGFVGEALGLVSEVATEVVPQFAPPVYQQPTYKPLPATGGSGLLGFVGDESIGKGLLLAAALAVATVVITGAKQGPPPVRAAGLLGGFFLLESGRLEGAFTALLGIIDGRFADPRPLHMVDRPSRGFLVDLSQMFVPPPPELGGGDVARQPVTE